MSMIKKQFLCILIIYLMLELELKRRMINHEILPISKSQMMANEALLNLGSQNWDTLGKTDFKYTIPNSK